MSFQNKVAFVSGVAGGIAFATAKAFAKAGANVAVTDIDERAAAIAVEELARHGHRALGIQCDVTDEASIANAIERTVAELGWLDVAYNDARVDVPNAETADALAEDFERAMAVNLKGVWLCMKHQLRRMRPQGRKAIVNCLSPSGLAGMAGLGADTAANLGVIGLTRTAAAEYARRRVRINAICPRTTDGTMRATSMLSYPQSIELMGDDNWLSRIGTPEETVLWLCGDKARFMIGQVVVPIAAPRYGHDVGLARRTVIEGPYPPIHPW